MEDKSSFEFLKLNADGTGIKCFGRTINGRDTLYLDHITALVVTNWRVEKDKLFLQSKNKLSFQANPEYIFELDKESSLKLQGEHLVFYLYPSYLNRDEFQRTVTYRKADRIPAGYGVNTASCIVTERKLFSFKPVDRTTHLAEYKGFDDLVPHIVSCGHGYEYAREYKDPAYSLAVPAFIRTWSFAFGNKSFYISLNPEKKDKGETSIVIYYDFGDEMKNFFFSEIKAGKEKKDIVKTGNAEIYKTINWQGKFEGKVFLPNSMIVAYYTRDEKLQETLQKCIASFRYR